MGKLFKQEDQDLPPLSEEQTELHRLETAYDLLTKQLNSTMERLVMESQSKSQFLANMSHEIRTPLHAVTGMCYLLQQTELTKKQHHFLDTIQSSSQHVTLLINDLLDISKIESGHLEVESIPFHLDELVDALANLSLSSGEATHNQLYLYTDPAIPHTLIGDPMRLNQVLINLTGNAFKFSENGYVVVRIECIEQQNNQATLQFSVEDQGIGMSDDQASHVFDLFRQADASTTRRFGGTGLGLTISKRLVEAMGGEIKVESQLNKGSCFTFSANVGCRAEHPSIKPQLPAQLSEMHLMVVHSSPIARKALQQMLACFDWNVDLIGSEDEAIEELTRAYHSSQRYSYDMVITEAYNPGQALPALVRSIDKIPQLARLPILMLGNLPQLGEESPTRLMHETLGMPITSKRLHQKLLEQFEPQMNQEQRLQLNEEAAAPALEGTVLLVDDQAINREIAMEILQPHYSVISAADGQEAVNAVLKTNTRFNAVLMDLQMPVMNGYEATEIIRERYPELPIIAMTAHALENDRQRCLDMGMNAHISKPFSAEQLLEEIRQWIPDEDSPPPQDRPQATEVQSQPLTFDWDAALKRLNGNRDLLLRLLSNFVVQADEMVTAITTDLKQGNSNTATTQCHALKGIAANLSADQLSRTAQQLHDQLKVGSPHQEKLDLLQTQYQLLKDELISLLEEQTPVPTEPADPLEIDQATLWQQMKELEQQLERNSFDASSHLDQLQHYIPSDLENHFALLSTSLERFQFSQARGHFEHIKQRLALEYPQAQPKE